MESDKTRISKPIFAVNQFDLEDYMAGLETPCEKTQRIALKYGLERPIVQIHLKTCHDCQRKINNK